MTLTTLIRVKLKATTGRISSSSGKGETRSVKHALLPFALILTGMVAFAAPTAGSMAPQYGSAGTSPSTPAAIYGRRCASCHGTDGRADTPKGKLRSTRNLTDPKWHAEVSDARIFNSIMNGRGYMPSFGKKLSEAEIDSLVSYVRGMKK